MIGSTTISTAESWEDLRLRMYGISLARMKRCEIITKWIFSGDFSTKETFQPSWLEFLEIIIQIVHVDWWLALPSVSSLTARSQCHIQKPAWGASILSRVSHSLSPVWTHSYIKNIYLYYVYRGSRFSWVHVANGFETRPHGSRIP